MAARSRPLPSDADDARRIGQELGFTIYLYEAPAWRDDRRDLVSVREGEYEALVEKLGTEAWRPDFGPNEWNDSTARSGALTVAHVGSSWPTTSISTSARTESADRSRSTSGRRTRGARRGGHHRQGSRWEERHGAGTVSPGGLQGGRLGLERVRSRPGLDQPRRHRGHEAAPGLRGLPRERPRPRRARDRQRTTGPDPGGDLLAAGKHYRPCSCSTGSSWAGLRAPRRSPRPSSTPKLRKCCSGLTPTSPPAGTTNEPEPRYHHDGPPRPRSPMCHGARQVVPRAVS
jgi:hypothetical protein